MSKINAASDNIKKLSQMFKGIIEFGEELEKMGSIENNVQELKLGKTQAIKEFEEVSKNLEYAKANVEQSKIEAAQNLEFAKSKGEQLISAAQIQADAILAKANSEFNDCQAALKQTKESFEISKQQRQQELSMLNDSISKAEMKLKEVNDQIEKLKSMIGG